MLDVMQDKTSLEYTCMVRVVEELKSEYTVHIYKPVHLHGHSHAHFSRKISFLLPEPPQLNGFLQVSISF